MSDRQKALSNIAPNASVDKRNFPVWRMFAENFDSFSEIGNYAVAVGPPVRIEKIVLDNVSLVAKAQYKVPVTILTVVLHDVSQDRLLTNWDHRLRNVLGILSDASTEP